MTRINYYIGEKTGTIFWAANEHFEELSGRKFELGKMEAVEIDKMSDLSTVAKLFLSAASGAVIQHLLDLGEQPEEIFSEGTFEIIL